MPVISFLTADGVRRDIDAPLGLSLMEVARQHGVAGVVAQCGGACACATCHVYIEPARLTELEAPEEMELGMLDGAWERRPNSRLSCQIAVTAGLDGLQVTVPARQCA